MNDDDDTGSSSLADALGQLTPEERAVIEAGESEWDQSVDADYAAQFEPLFKEFEKKGPEEPATEAADRSKLVRSTITDKHGVERHVWIHPDEPTAPRTSAGLAPEPNPPTNPPTGEKPTPTVGPDTIVPHALASLAHDFPDAASDPTTWGKVKEVAGKVKEAIHGLLIRATPYILPIANEIFDTPDDFNKFGFAPSVSGTHAANIDPMKAATGLSTHLVLGIASKVLSHGIVWAKSRLTKEGVEAGDTVESAADWIAEMLSAVAQAVGIDDLAVDKAAVLAAVKAIVAKRSA